MPEVQEVFRMATQRVQPDPGFVDRQYEHRRKQERNRKIGAFGVVAAIGAVVVALFLGTRGGPNATAPADEPSTATLTTRAEEVARRFVGAFGASDAERAIASLADDADITDLITSMGARVTDGTPNELRLLISLLEAQGYRQWSRSCEETGSLPAGTDVRCAFDFQLLGSDDFGRGLFHGSYFDFTVRDGKIVRASLYWETERFSPQMWEPFASWVSSAHTDNAAMMYEDETYSAARLTVESIRLWGQRTREWVNDMGSIEGAPIGRHSRIVDGVPFSFRVPDGGWAQFGTISINKGIVGPQGAEAIIFWTGFPDGVYADPCANVLSPPSGSTVADLAAAVSTAPGTELVSGPSDVTVGGHPAKHVVLTVREDVGCDPGYFYTWADVRWGTLWPATRVGDTIRVWIVDVGGTRLFIEAETNEHANSALEQEIQQIVGSIRFD